MTNSTALGSLARSCASVGNVTSGRAAQHHWSASEASPPEATPAGRGRKREVPFQRADDRARNQPESPWERLTIV